MSLLDHWQIVSAQNGCDKLSDEDQEVLKNVYFTGAVACCAELQSREENRARAAHAELKEFASQHRNLQVPSIN